MSYPMCKCEMPQLGKTICWRCGRRRRRINKGVEGQLVSSKPFEAGCVCGHRLDQHKQTMPGKVLCMGCLNEDDNRSVIGCETFILKNAEAI